MRTLTASSLVGLSVLGLCLPAAAAAAEDQPVLIRMQLPANAEVWFNGAATVQTGTVREFLTPAIAPGKNYSYQVRVRWMADGKAVEQERKLSIRAGQQVNVDVSKENVSVTQTAYYPRGRNSTAAPSYAPYSYGAPTWYNSDYYPYSPASSMRSGPSVLDWEPYDGSDFLRFKFGRE